MPYCKWGKCNDPGIAEKPIETLARNGDGAAKDSQLKELLDWKPAP